MRCAAAALLLCIAGQAQTVIPPFRVPAIAAQFERAASQPLHCEVTPIGPTLNYAFRFQAGWSFRVPSPQYQGSNHTWVVLTKITPEGRDPVHLYSRIRPADIVNVDLDFEMAGSYLLGEGGYTVEATLVDDQNRVCKRQWRVDVKLARNQHSVRPAIAPLTVLEFSSRGPQNTAGGDKKPAQRLTVMLDAAPLNQRRTTLSVYDRQRLLGALAGLMERVPASVVRLVVFSMEQQKEVLRDEHFTLDGMDRVKRALESLELASVNVSVLQKPLGHVELLKRLVAGEESAAEPSATVIFLGPLSRYHDKLTEDLWPASTKGGPRFFYVQLKPLPRRPPPDAEIVIPEPAGPDGIPPTVPAGSSGGRSGAQSGAPQGTPARGGLPQPLGIPAPPSGQSDSDLINSVMAKVRGRTLVVHTPAEYARALEQVPNGRTATASK